MEPATAPTQPQAPMSPLQMWQNVVEGQPHLNQNPNGNPQNFIPAGVNPQTPGGGSGHSTGIAAPNPFVQGANPDPSQNAGGGGNNAAGAGGGQQPPERTLIDFVVQPTAEQPAVGQPATQPSGPDARMLADLSALLGKPIYDAESYSAGLKELAESRTNQAPPTRQQANPGFDKQLFSDLLEIGINPKNYTDWVDYYQEFQKQNPETVPTDKILMSYYQENGYANDPNAAADLISGMTDQEKGSMRTQAVAYFKQLRQQEMAFAHTQINEFTRRLNDFRTQRDVAKRDTEAARYKGLEQAANAMSSYNDRFVVRPEHKEDILNTIRLGKMEETFFNGPDGKFDPDKAVRNMFLIKYGPQIIDFIEKQSAASGAAGLINGLNFPGQHRAGGTPVAPQQGTALDAWSQFISQREQAAAQPPNQGGMDLSSLINFLQQAQKGGYR